MFATPTSSPKITRMLGFPPPAAGAGVCCAWACWTAAPAASVPKVASAVPASNTRRRPEILRFSSSCAAVSAFLDSSLIVSSSKRVDVVQDRDLPQLHLADDMAHLHMIREYRGVADPAGRQEADEILVIELRPQFESGHLRFLLGLEPVRNRDLPPVTVQPVGIADVMQPLQHDGATSLQELRRPQQRGAEAERFSHEGSQHRTAAAVPIDLLVPVTLRAEREGGRHELVDHEIEMELVAALVVGGGVGGVEHDAGQHGEFGASGLVEPGDTELGVEGPVVAADIDQR